MSPTVTRPLLFTVTHLLVGACGSFGQDVKNDSTPAHPAGFEGKEVGDDLGREAGNGKLMKVGPSF
jgi:hypothetical protein